MSKRKTKHQKKNNRTPDPMTEVRAACRGGAPSMWDKAKLAACLDYAVANGWTGWAIKSWCMWWHRGLDFFTATPADIRVGVSLIYALREYRDGRISPWKFLEEHNANEARFENGFRR